MSVKSRQVVTYIENAIAALNRKYSNRAIDFSYHFTVETDRYIELTSSPAKHYAL